MQSDNEFLTPRMLIDRYKNAITLRTLANWRSIGDGPEYTKIGGRVLYTLSKVLAWETKRTIKLLILFGLGLLDGCGILPDIISAFMTSTGV